MSPVSSATGMKSEGAIQPRSGCSQRSSASNPAIRPVRARRSAGNGPGTRAARSPAAGRSPASTARRRWCASPGRRPRAAPCPTPWPDTSPCRRRGAGPRAARGRSSPARSRCSPVAKTSCPPRLNGAFRSSRTRSANSIASLMSPDVVGEDRELVAPEPGERVAPAQSLLEPPADRDQELVAGGVPQAVVDDLEAVEVEEQHGEMVVLLAFRSEDRPAEPVHEQRRLGRSVSESWKAS